MWNTVQVSKELDSLIAYASSQLPREIWWVVGRTLSSVKEVVQHEQWAVLPPEEWTESHKTWWIEKLVEKGLSEKEIASVREVWQVSVSQGRIVAPLLELLAAAWKEPVVLDWSLQCADNDLISTLR